MNRNEFVKRLIRYLLFGILGAIALFAGSRASLAADCDSCPGKGICKGETDCKTFLNKDNGRR